MPYRENAKQKNTLYYVHISWTKDSSSKSNQRWIRAKDSFKALSKVLKELEVEANQLWSQHVISADDFAEKELEVE